MKKYLLDPTKFRFEQIGVRGESVFSSFVSDTNEKKPRIVKTVKFYDYKFQDMDYYENGVRFSYYGTCNIDQYEAVLLDDDTYLFCVVSGSAFNGTDQTSDNVTMRYYKVTPL